MQLITGTTQLLGIIGHPVEHSLSPVMHNAAMTQLGLDYVYVPFPVKPKDLQTALAGFATIGVVGLSVTIPHKQTIMPLLSEISETAQAVGAVNTVWRTSRGWSGTNTDVAGFLAPLQRESRDWSQTTVLILGYGGAARAVVAGCAELGCKQIHLVGRDIAKLKSFQYSWENSPLSVKIDTHLWEELPQLISQADLLVNTTPVGMYPQVEASPVEEALMTQLSAGAIVYDLIYTPRPTQFLELAARQGITTIDGLEMLVQQGVAALKIWLQLSQVPVDVMFKSLQDHLENK